TTGVGVEIAAEIAGEPRDVDVDRFADRARQTRCGVVVGLGGGAAMDAAKLVAAIVCQHEPSTHYALAAHPFPAQRLPAIAVPTTAGTGSEVTRTAIISSAQGDKHWYWGEALMFSHAVLDPELTVSMPPHITAWTGIDAVAHGLEGMTSRASNPVGCHHGLAALEILGVWLPRAVENGDDIEARSHVLWASTLAGLTLHNCNTHMGHNISHALGSLAPVHHGLATGLALEVVLPELVARPDGSDTFARAAAALGATRHAHALPARFSALMRQCGIEPALPAACDGLLAKDLSAHMKRDYNVVMAQNAPGPISDADLDAFAEAMLALPRDCVKAA
ncbi:MAG: iron-containing alcohol dehydrogenase, partial [Pseudomonadota bacterium]